jgi:hypothetical protein
MPSNIAVRVSLAVMLIANHGMDPPQSGRAPIQDNGKDSHASRQGPSQCAIHRVASSRTPTTCISDMNFQGLSRQTSSVAATSSRATPTGSEGGKGAFIHNESGQPVKRCPADESGTLDKTRVQAIHLTPGLAVSTLSLSVPRSDRRLPQAAAEIRVGQSASPLH